ncbi:MAG TPA: anhydro-N-acetylmuramic acid kinase [Flavitalea sp.]|nr:anhydro-N-acetylmuramic acid kinase [Flavitalea sp.]
MVYRAIGLMSGSSMDGLDIAFAEFQETSGKWNFEIKAVACYPYDEKWIARLKNATELKALDYQLLHTAYGHYTGKIVNRFIEENNLHHQVQLIASHGHTTFHVPSERMTAQLGDGAAIAAETGINTVSDLRAMDLARGGHGAPIVPIGEKLLLGEYPIFLNLGGIANISFNDPKQYIAFDVCPANRVLNLLSASLNKHFDEGGQIASSGRINEKLLSLLNDLEYYGLPYPKSLSNDFGTDVVYTLIRNKKISAEDGLRTYVEHVAIQIKNAIRFAPGPTSGSKILLTGGGAHNHFLVGQISATLREFNIEVVVPDKNIVDYKEAIIMALIGVLRWREETTTLASVTGASANSIGGAVWIGQEA